MTQASGNARWAELVQTLNELNKTYHDVCELGRKKHKALIVIDLKSIEAMEKVADGKATKIIIPSELQGFAGLASGIAETVKETK